MMDAWPSRSCTTFAGNSRPPSTFRLMHHDAKKCRSEMQARVLRLPDGLALLVEHDLAVVVLDDQAHAGRDQCRQEAANDNVL